MCELWVDMDVGRGSFCVKVRGSPSLSPSPSFCVKVGGVLVLTISMLVAAQLPDCLAPLMIHNTLDNPLHDLH